MRYYSPTLATLIFFLWSAVISAQALNLSVVDEAGHSVPYTTVFAPALPQGLITDAEGRFVADWVTAPDTTTVIFSAVGYQTVRLSMRQLTAFASQQQHVVLPRVAYTINAVEVAGKRLKLQRKRLGLSGWLNALYSIPARSTFNFGEAGPIIRPAQRCRLDAIELRVKQMTADTVLLDLNVYALEGQQVKNQLLRERLFVKVAKQDVGRNLVVDLSDQQLWVTGDFLVTFRLLDVLGETGVFTFKGKTGGNRGRQRRTDGQWANTSTTPALYARVSYEK